MVNLQISITGNHAASNTTYTQPSKNGVEPKPLVNQEKELHRMERQGEYVTLGEQQLVRSIDRAIKALQGPETMVEVNVHEKTQAIMIKVLNKETGEIIREIPPEQTLEIVAKMMEFAGLIIDERR
ncbi:flagellar protein FlaG [Paenibacillus sp. N3/727]|uniref:flagellar protein FlaG n=1 Tax=Paenibacillus sp. N3/727 TaxID=2925845 RepID=UPI001F538753|nr:flagellar protein FlaG [Paenibacillus sp. N3/727]UNK18064.1 flagellar protein FlaG [Paenibacillus sp. N3/727]